MSNIQLDDRVLDGHTDKNNTNLDLKVTQAALEKTNAATPSAQSKTSTQEVPSKRPQPKGVPSDDALAVLSPKEAAEWYHRLAESIRQQYPQSLAAKMMLHWLDGKGKKEGDKFTFDSAYIKDIGFVIDYLADEVRPVFLTEKKAELKGGDRWAGILPRIKDPSWDRKSKFKIFYEGPPVEMPLMLLLKAELGTADPKEVDLVMSLHKFGIHTDVVMSASPIEKSKKYNVKFESWESWAFDSYDWDPRKHLTVPNPDYGNSEGLAPDKKKVTVYHTNAKRVESAGLAAPYKVESTHWQVTLNRIRGPSVVDSDRNL
jgi:hypothetical protein